MEENVKYTVEILDDQFLVLKPSSLLTDAEYDRVKPLIEKMGGHWREKVKGFIFYTDASHMKNHTQRKEELQFFPTPKKVVDRMLELSGIVDVPIGSKPRVLEPSAGTGNIIDAIRYKHPSLYIVEPDEENVNTLVNKGYWMVEQTTFEYFHRKQHKKLKNYMDYVLMNPPFSESRDVLHTMLAYDFLKPGGTLVAILSENALYYENEHSKKFREWLKDKDAYIEEVPFGAFKESGTTVDTVMIKIVKK